MATFREVVTFEDKISVSYNGRKINVWSDSRNRDRKIQKYYYDPLFDLEPGLTASYHDLLQLVITLWSEELEIAIEKKINELYGDEMKLVLEMMPIDSVKLDWRNPIGGIKEPSQPISLSQCPMNQTFGLACDSVVKARDLKCYIRESPHVIVWGLHADCEIQGCKCSYKVNLPNVENPAILQALRNEIASLKRKLDNTITSHNALKDSIKQHYDNFENRFEQIQLNNIDESTQQMPKQSGK